MLNRWYTDQINASWACENDRALNQLLKGENGFQGYVMSDWGAHHSTLAAVAGLDVSIIFPSQRISCINQERCASDVDAGGHRARLGD